MSGKAKIRRRAAKQYLVGGTIVAVGLSALASPIGLLTANPAAATSTSPYVRFCGTRQDGWLVNNRNEVHGPWHISMTKSQAERYQKRFPTQEFGSHITLNQTPCLVGEGIAVSASRAWRHWHGSHGRARIGVGTSGGITYLGWVRCSSHLVRNPWAISVTCNQPYRGSQVVVGKFAITKNPYNH
jgi:hypothetical protein